MTHIVCIRAGYPPHAGVLFIKLPGPGGCASDQAGVSQGLQGCSPFVGPDGGPGPIFEGTLTVALHKRFTVYFVFRCVELRAPAFAVHAHWPLRWTEELNQKLPGTEMEIVGHMGRVSGGSCRGTNLCAHAQRSIGSIYADCGTGVWHTAAANGGD